MRAETWPLNTYALLPGSPLVLATEAGRFAELRRELFSRQPAEGTGGFTDDDLLEFGMSGRSFVSGVREARYERWILCRESHFDSEDPQGTPAVWLNGQSVDGRVLFNPRAFAQLLRH